MVTGAFRATSLPALDIEAFVLPIQQKLDKLSCESLLRIVSCQRYETIVTQRPRPSKNKNISPLEILCRRFEKRFCCKIEHLERIVPFITLPWWIPPTTEIASSKHEAKACHDCIIQTHDPQRQLIVYTDGSGINGKIGAAAVIPSQNASFKAYLGSAHFFTVYLGELQGVAMALNSTTPVRNQLLQKLTIFTDNQSAIHSIAAPSAQSGQQILRFIVDAIDRLREQNIEVEVRWIPAHIGVDGNERADSAAKEAKGWRKVKRRNGKLIEIDTSHTSPSPNLPYLRSAVKASLTEKLHAEWEDDWHKETKGRTLYKIAPKPSRKVLHLHNKLPKWTSSLMVQMRTGKIGLRKFLYERNVPDISNTECACGEGEETVRHVLTECSQFSELRKITWADEVKKARYNWIDLRSILTTSAYLKKAVEFMQKTGLLGQYRGLKWDNTT